MDPKDLDPQAERKRIVAGRNRALALVLFGLVVLFFAITIAKLG
jgi:hypothetical protein